MKFVVIGGDAAGMSAASRTKRLLPDTEVTVLEQSQDISYSACGMPYNIADEQRDIDDLVVRQASVFREKQGIQVFTGHRVEGIDPAAKVVWGVADGKGVRFPYDRLLIATGGRAIKPRIPGIENDGVMVLKSLEDGRNIKTWMRDRKVNRVVIVGMGYIALEMAEAFRNRGLDVTMIKPRPMLLPWMPVEMAQVVQNELERHKTTLLLGHHINRIEPSDQGLSVICDSVVVDGDLVLIAVGIEPNSDMAADAGLQLSVQRAIAVDRAMCSTVADIYAAGDCADAYHVVTGQKTWIPLALRANRAGWAVADHMAGKPVSIPGVVGTAVFKVFDLEVARSGLTMEEAKQYGFDPVGVTITTKSRAHAHPGAETLWAHMVGDRQTGRLLGAQLVGKEGAAHRINSVAVALHSKMTVDQFHQTDLSYAPPFGPVWDPLLTVSGQLMKEL